MTVLKTLELSRINRDEHPDFFYKNSIHEDTADNQGYTNFLTVKNPELVNLRDNFDSSAWQGLRIAFRRCINETSTVECASDDEID